MGTPGAPQTRQDKESGFSLRASLSLITIAIRCGTNIARPVAPVPNERSAMFRRVLILIWLAVAAVSLLAGLGYYVTPIQDRGYSDLQRNAP